MPAQEQRVIAQRHSVLFRPRRGAEAAGPMDENYALLEHDPTLGHGPVNNAGDIAPATYLLPPRNLSKPLGRFSCDGSKSAPCWPKEVPVGSAFGPAARRASASLS